MTQRENKRTTEDPIDLHSPPVDQATKTAHGLYFLSMVEPSPELDGRVALSTPIFTLMDFVAPNVPPERSPIAIFPQLFLIKLLVIIVPQAQE